MRGCTGLAAAREVAVVEVHYGRDLDETELQGKHGVYVRVDAVDLYTCAEGKLPTGSRVVVRNKT